ncbi:MAG: Rieske 2Fe-2S domain-containing protein [Candidatus Dormibacteraeota bacterium]|nr:Rieske 2Fe-2S domain-containing protein [Candidatus Dormibacteraeota bacterium]
MSLIETTPQFAVSRRIYNDEGVHHAELERIFRRTWLFVAHESEIPEPGDYVTRRLGLDPVIVSRDEAGQIRVLLNTCRHRGTRLCRADRGNTSHFRCSYHGWTYANNGDLRGVTFQREVFGGDFDKARFGLFRPPHVETFQGLIFACWDPAAPTLLEYLGPMAWYLTTVLGKFDDGVELIGAPVRTLIHANWKSESENLSGDGYHTPITHGTAFKLGLFATPSDLEQLGEVSGPRFTGRTVDCGNGHTMRIQRLPLTTTRPAFFGYPKEMWAQMERNLTAAQVEVQSCLSVGHGTIFPNFSFLENFKTSVDGPGRHARYIRFTLRYPLSPNLTEVLWFGLRPRGADQAWQRLSQLGYLRTNGPAGMFEVDDLENFVSISEAHEGNVSRDLDFNLEGGRHHPEAPATLGWPGDVVDGDRTEKTIRAFLLRWHDLIEGEPAAAITGASQSA